MATSYVPPELIPAKAYSKLPPRILIEAAIETLIQILDAADPDTDFEELGAEDSFQAHDDDGAGCPVADCGGGNVEDEGEAIDEREPDHDAEVETWSHPDDHPGELFKRTIRHATYESSPDPCYVRLHNLLNGGLR